MKFSCTPAVLDTPHAFFHRAALCPSLASARRSFATMALPCAHMQQGSHHVIGGLSPC
ncbi:MAG TPA: hypothetical protein VHL60_05185 [Oxalicibacterium sp.]|nr:hypothetical protein [Oxalicibacterium sp.]